MLKQAIISGANKIISQKNRINDLNIFPVPDGDTGTNMSMTIEAAVRELNKTNSDNAGEVAKIAASAMLRGARGNSGVILSILFRGFSKGLQGKADVTGKDMTEALGLGVEAAYSAVMKPTEGTILTVARVAYEESKKALAETDDLVKIWQIIVDAANEALADTPNQLPVLKKAGVVDAGGKGLCTIFEGMLSVFKDGIVADRTQDGELDDNNNEEDDFRSAAAEFDDDIRFTYCTEFIVGRDTEVAIDPQDLRKFLETIGDCVVLVEDDEIIKVHVHTEQPGNALQQALAYGQLLTVKVENMKEQHKNAKEANQKSKSPAARGDKLRPQEPTEEFGFVAVAAGQGLAELFTELGCANVVSGGQSMNPSTKDIYEAVLATPAKVVYVFPNNKNIIMAAEQSVNLIEDRQVIIVPTKTIPQGLSAMLVFDSELSPEDNKEAMTEQAQAVATGLVTFAARDSEFGGKKIKESDIIALQNGKLTISEKTTEKAITRLAKAMINKNSSFVTLIYGEGTPVEEAESVAQSLEQKYGEHADITLIKGDQPVYYYILSVE
jgi:DAK2 domain fusion protein YloV